MVQDAKPLTFFTMVLGNTLNIHQEFLRRLRQRLHLTEVYDANNCDVIIAFVPTASRAGTDIQAALLNIPNTGQPVVLVALHFTFDEHHVVPNSSSNINRTNVFAVEVLCYEDLGLLRSLCNDQALKAVTDHLISMGGSPYTQLPETTRSQRPCSSFIFVWICIIVFIALAIMIGFTVYLMKRQPYIKPTPSPNTTMTTLPPNTTTS